MLQEDLRKTEERFFVRLRRTQNDGVIRDAAACVVGVGAALGDGTA
jgi:hypothetical protein